MQQVSAGRRPFFALNDGYLNVAMRTRLRLRRRPLSGSFRGKKEAPDDPV
jgi:hypothetical protein